MLPATPSAAPSQGQEHRMSRHGRVTHKGRFLAGIEEAQPHIVIRALFAANTKATSACENSRATACKVASLCPSASSTTVAGLPVKRVR
jgi:hypothetical protein